MIIKNEYPILEYSTDKIAVINPDRNASKPDRDGRGEGGFRRFPRLCLRERLFSLAMEALCLL